MKKPKLSFVVFLAICAGSLLRAQVDTGLIARIEQKVPLWQTENHVPAVGLGIIEEGEIKYIRVFGELKQGVPAPENTFFSVASITKPVVALLTLKMVEAGLWDLDEPLCHYWTDPDVAGDPFAETLTSRHVLNHQTGFPNWRQGKLAFEFEPGTDLGYSGEGFEYLRKALERKLQTPLASLSDSLIFKPLGMHDSHLCWNNSLNDSRFACKHDAEGNMYKSGIPKGGSVNAAASFITTVEDLCKLSIAVINGFGFSDHTYTDMVTPHVKVKEHYAKGLGWEVVTDLPGSEYALEHAGSDGGVKTIFFVLPESGRGMVILTNGDNGVFVYQNIIREFFEHGQMLLTYLNGSEQHEEIRLTHDILDRYVGDYLDSYGRNHKIYREGDTLLFSGNGLPTVILHPKSEHTFFLADFDVQFEFVDENSLVLIENGKTGWTATKVVHQTAIDLPDNILEKYTGMYVRTDNNTDIQIIKGEGSILKMTGESVPPLDLYPTGINTFFAEDFPYQFEFVREDSGRALQIHVIGNGKVLCEIIRKNEN